MMSFSFTHDITHIFHITKGNTQPSYLQVFMSLYYFAFYYVSYLLYNMSNNMMKNKKITQKRTKRTIVNLDSSFCRDIIIIIII